MTEPRCGKCRFWVQYAAVTDAGPNRGKCRRHVPAVHIVAGHSFSEWPETKRDDWCGELEAKPEPVAQNVQEQSQPKFTQKLP